MNGIEKYLEKISFVLFQMGYKGKSLEHHVADIESDLYDRFDEGADFNEVYEKFGRPEDVIKNYDIEKRRPWIGITSAAVPVLSYLMLFTMFLLYPFDLLMYGKGADLFLPQSLYSNKLLLVGSAFFYFVLLLTGFWNWAFTTHDPRRILIERMSFPIGIVGGSYTLFAALVLIIAGSQQYSAIDGWELKMALFVVEVTVITGIQLFLVKRKQGLPKIAHYIFTGIVYPQVLPIHFTDGLDDFKLLHLNHESIGSIFNSYIQAQQYTWVLFPIFGGITALVYVHRKKADVLTVLVSGNLFIISLTVYNIFGVLFVPIETYLGKESNVYFWLMFLVIFLLMWNVLIILSGHSNLVAAFKVQKHTYKIDFAKLRLILSLVVVLSISSLMINSYLLHNSNSQFTIHVPENTKDGQKFYSLHEATTILFEAESSGFLKMQVFIPEKSIFDFKITYDTSTANRSLEPIQTSINGYIRYVFSLEVQKEAIIWMDYNFTLYGGNTVDESKGLQIYYDYNTGFVTGWYFILETLITVYCVYTVLRRNEDE